MKYFDAHTHTNFLAYENDRDEVMKRTQEAGVGINVVGTQLDTSKTAIELAEKYDNAWATVGLHPVHTSKSFHDAKEFGHSFAEASKGKEGFMSRGETFDADAYEPLLRHPRVIALGECGLDYYRLEEETKRIQQEAFVAQIELANNVGKPLMLHIRNAYEDALALLREHAKVRGDVHFFAGDWEVARKFLDLGFTLSFTGVLTFTEDYHEVVRNAPFDMILSETDAPYITPTPYRGKRNEPAYVAEVVKAIAAIKGETLEKTASTLLENARRVFNVDL
ncbi:MAG TPA: TatD family hydrolase [Candidatus Paceibacterota bacterium]|nr:TatD family hydrolase [Candidatus Paceibacterota bacterium]